MDPPPGPIKPNCTETMLCCGGVDSQQHRGCSPEIQSPYSTTTTTTHLPRMHMHMHMYMHTCLCYTHFIISALSPQLARIPTPPTWLLSGRGSCCRTRFGISACNQLFIVLAETDTDFYFIIFFVLRFFTSSKLNCPQTGSNQWPYPQNHQYDMKQICAGTHTNVNLSLNNGRETNAVLRK